MRAARVPTSLHSRLKSLRRTSIGAAAATLIVAAFGTSIALAQSFGENAIHRWLDANTRAIARIHNEKKRLAAQRTFAETRTALRNEQGRRLNLTPPQDAQRLAVFILSNQRLYKFSHPAVPAAKPWWQRFFEWLSEQWSHLMRAIFGRAAIPARVNRGIANVLLAASILIFMALVARVLWLYGRRSRSKVVAVPLAVPEDPTTFVRLSKTAADAGNYALAVAHLFAAALTLLKIKKRFGGRASDTAREMSASIASTDPRLREPFDELTNGLTRAVYAEHALSQDDWTRSLGAYRRLEGLLQP